MMEISVKILHIYVTYLVNNFVSKCIFFILTYPLFISLFKRSCFIALKYMRYQNYFVFKAIVLIFVTAEYRALSSKEAHWTLA